MNDFIHITPAGEAAGLDAAMLNDLLERHARDVQRRTVTLPDSEFRVVADVTPPRVPATAHIQ